MNLVSYTILLFLPPAFSPRNTTYDTARYTRHTLQQWGRGGRGRAAGAAGTSVVDQSAAAGEPCTDTRVGGWEIIV